MSQPSLTHEALTLPSGVAEADFPAVARMLRDDTASAALGMRVVDLGVGTATLQMTVREDMCQGHGMCHGGYIFTVADSTFAAACNSHGPVTVAASVQIQYLAPAYAGETLTATGREVERWGRNGMYDIEVRNEKGVVAQFRGISRTIERSSS